MCRNLFPWLQVEDKVKVKGMEPETQEWHEDPIPGMASENVESESESDSDSDSEYGRPGMKLF